MLEKTTAMAPAGCSAQGGETRLGSTGITENQVLYIPSLGNMPGPSGEAPPLVKESSRRTKGEPEADSRDTCPWKSPRGRKRKGATIRGRIGAPPTPKRPASADGKKVPGAIITLGLDTSPQWTLEICHPPLVAQLVCAMMGKEGVTQTESTKKNGGAVTKAVLDCGSDPRRKSAPGARDSEGLPDLLGDSLRADAGSEGAARSDDDIPDPGDFAADGTQAGDMIPLLEEKPADEKTDQKRDSKSQAPSGSARLRDFLPCSVLIGDPKGVPLYPNDLIRVNVPPQPGARPEGQMLVVFRVENVIAADNGPLVEVSFIGSPDAKFANYAGPRLFPRSQHFSLRAYLHLCASLDFHRDQAAPVVGDRRFLHVSHYRLVVENELVEEHYRLGLIAARKQMPDAEALKKTGQVPGWIPTLERGVKPGGAPDRVKEAAARLGASAANDRERGASTARKEGGQEQKRHTFDQPEGSGGRPRRQAPGPPNNTREPASEVEHLKNMLAEEIASARESRKKLDDALERCNQEERARRAEHSRRETRASPARTRA